MKNYTRAAFAAATLFSVIGLSACEAEKIESSNDATSDSVTTTANEAKTGKTDKKTDKGSRDAEVMACMKNKAVKQINLTEGAIGMADVYTNLAGDMMGPNTGKAKLIVAAFTRCAGTKSGNGLITVYSADGEILSNGNF